MCASGAARFRPAFAVLPRGIPFARRTSVQRNQSRHLRSFADTGEERYALTLWTDHHQDRLGSSVIADGVLSRFEQCARHEGVTIAGCDLQPDHLSLVLIATRPNADRFVTRAKQITGYWFSTTYGGRLWEREGTDSALARAG